MRAQLKKMAIFVVGIILMITVTACGEPNAIEYVDGFQKLINDNKTLYDTLTIAVDKYLTDFTEDQKTALTTTLTSLQGNYKALGEMKTPEVYAEVEPMFQGASENALAAIAIYSEEFGEITKETFAANSTDLLARLEEADKLMEEANTKMIEAVTKVREIGGGEEESSGEESGQTDKKEDDKSDSKAEGSDKTSSPETASKE